jgi:NADPH:quinone reductase-like Zn-dependent oxidoreductase
MADTKPSKKTMRGWAIKGYGEPMQLMDVPVPREPGSRDVVIKMRGAEVGDWDELVRKGEWDMEREFPLVLGLAGAGTAVSVGRDVQGFNETDRVYAYSYPLYDNGAWAQYMMVPDSYLAHAPSSLDLLRAGALPIVGLTAHETLVDILDVQEDDIIVISAAAGGVGHLAVQIASGVGAHVVATTSGRNRNFVADLGAETVIDYTAEDDMTKAIRAIYPGGVDKVLNGVAGEDANDYVWALREGGKMVDLPGTVTVKRPDVEVVSDYVVRGDGDRLGIVTRMIDGGVLQLVVQDIFQFNHAPDALDMVLNKHVRGKVALEIQAM